MSPASEKEIEQLKSELASLKSQINAAGDSPFLSRSVKWMAYDVALDREEVTQGELGKKINEKHGTMYQIKEQSRAMAQILGLDADSIRMLVTEAVQNILEHGHGKWVTVRMELRNEGENPCMVSSFKHEIAPTENYTLDDVDFNAMKGDFASEHFDFESSRGRGEFIMKQLTDERRIINGIEVNREGKKVHYFKRILINYKNPQGIKERVNFQEIKEQLDRLDHRDVVCCFMIQHSFEQPDQFTIAAGRDHEAQLTSLMESHGCKLKEQEPYFRAVFNTYSPEKKLSKEELLELFNKARNLLYL